MTITARKKGKRANSVSRAGPAKGFANENRVANDVPKVGARQTESTRQTRKRRGRSRPALSHRYHTKALTTLTHSGPSAEGRADEYCRSLAPTQSSLVLSTHDPPQQEPSPSYLNPHLRLPFHSALWQLSALASSDRIHCILLYPQNRPSNTPPSTVTMVSCAAVNTPAEHSLTPFFQATDSVYVSNAANVSHCDPCITCGPSY